MLRTITSIRARQFLRILHEIGIINLILLIVVSVPFLAGIVYFATQKDPLYLLITWFVLILAVQLSRKDKKFVAQICPASFRFFLIEYGYLFLPFAALMIYRGEWIYLVLGIFLLLAVPFVPFTLNFNAGRVKAFDSFPAFMLGALEWKEGLRRNWYSLLPVYLMSLTFAWWEASVPIGIFLMALITCSWYLDCESELLLSLRMDRPSGFLWKMAAKHLFWFWMALLPHLLLFLFFFMDYWYVLVIIMVMTSTFPIMAIVFKYANYQPGINLKQNSTILALMVGFMSLPFTQPVPLVMSVVYYFRARKNLYPYTNATD